MSGLTYLEYNKKSLAVKGDPSQYDDALKSIGARRHSKMRDGGQGWLIPKENKKELDALIKKLKQSENKTAILSNPSSENEDNTSDESCSDNEINTTHDSEDSEDSDDGDDGGDSGDMKSDDEEIENSDEEIENSDEEIENSDEEIENSDEEIENSDEETESDEEEIKSGNNDKHDYEYSNSKPSRPLRECDRKPRRTTKLPIKKKEEDEEKRHWEALRREQKRQDEREARLREREKEKERRHNDSGRYGHSKSISAANKTSRDVDLDKFIVSQLRKMDKSKRQDVLRAVKRDKAEIRKDPKGYFAREFPPKDFRDLHSSPARRWESSSSDDSDGSYGAPRPRTPPRHRRPSSRRHNKDKEIQSLEEKLRSLRRKGK